MKKTIFLSILILTSLSNLAQGIQDALRYSSNNNLGTARFTALSGAFGALGGDLSALSVNPAGSSVFINNHAGFSFSVNSSNNATNYFNTATDNSFTDFNITNAGAVFVFDNYNENSPWKEFTIGLNYNINNTYDNDIFYRGTSNTSTGNFFLERAQGLPLDLLQLQVGENIGDLYTFLGEREGTAAQYAFLGYQGFLFNPVEELPTNTNYVSNFGSGNYNQSYDTQSTGYSGKYTFNLSTQFKDNLYLGVNLNSYSIDYFENSSVFETNNNANSNIREIFFEESLAVIGSGFSAQIGAIAKLNEGLRLGFNYTTPTWYNINEETTQFLETVRIENNQSILTTVNPRIINVFETYRLRTPGEINLNSAYVFGKKGLISFDYGFQDFSSTRFRPGSSVFFANQNNLIEDNLQGSSSYRLGGEYRIENFSLRGGLSLQESPYKDKNIVSNRNGFSLGLGYTTGIYNFDFAYAYSNQEQNGTFNNTQQAPVNLLKDQSNFVFTFSINL